MTKGRGNRSKSLITQHHLRYPSERYFWILFAILSIFVLIQTRFLRPIADDYCFGASGDETLLHFLKTNYQNSGGELFSRGLQKLLIGNSLLHLPWSISSAIPFVLSIVSVSLLLASLTTSIFSMTLRQISLQSKLMFLCSITTAWISYWWLPAVINFPKDLSLQLANTITFWQTVNVGYVICSCTLVAFIIALRSRLEKFTSLFAFISCLMLGLLLGLSGLVTAAIILIVMFLIGAAKAYLKRRLYIQDYSFASLFAGISIGAAVNYLSPGTQSRSSQLKELYKWTDGSFASYWNWMFPEAISDWISSILHPGILVSFLCGVITFRLLDKLEMSAPKVKLESLISGLLLISFGYSLLNRFAESQSYPAFWHFVPMHIVNFAAIYLFGIRVSLNRFRNKTSEGISTYRRLVVGSFFVMLLVSTLSIANFSNQVSTRGSSWANSVTPIIGPEDKNPGGWVEACWIRLKDARAKNGA